MNRTLKYIDEWGLDKRTKRIVKDYLREWLLEFIDRADGQMGNPQKLNWKEDEVAFFTDYRDILSKTKESRCYETDSRIRKRKRNVLMQLFLRQLLGDEIKLPLLQCSHCGYAPMDFEGCENGYYRYCPECRRIVFDSLVSNILLDTLNNVRKEIVEKYKLEEYN